MKTDLFGTDAASLKKAAEIIKNGGLVAFPTETVYGLGANGFNEQAVKNIFITKGRPQDNPLILHIAELSQVKQLAREIPPELEKLACFLPGPLTFILKRSDMVPDVVTAGLDTVAIRIPSQPAAHEFIKLAGVPIAAPSANLSGKPSPTTCQHCIADLDGKIEGIICGEGCDVGVESTILDLSVDVPTILRPGGITKEMLEKVLGRVETAGLKNNRPKAPGMKYKHYAPKAPLIITRGSLADELKTHDGRIGVITTERLELDSRYIVRHLGDTPEEYAANLYAALRFFDQMNVDFIISQDIVGDGICEAVRNRLYKAASEIKE